MTETRTEHDVLGALTRRRFLQGSALAGFGTFLAACGGGATPSPAASAGASTPPDGGAIEGPLNWANWPAYIDLNDDESASPTLVAFEEEYGIEVNYVEDIQTNEDFFASIQPALQAGLDTGWDLIVLTDYMAARLVNLGWVEEINQANTPTAASNVREALRGLAWDPDFSYHYPYQSGATGVGYNVVSTGRDLTKIEDVFDPAFKGKVTMLAGYQDTFSLTGLLLIERGEISNPVPEMVNEDADKIFAFLKPYVDDGHIRAFTGNEYLQDFASGDTWVAYVWSGDLASSGGENDVFVYPEEGSIIWTDNYLIPKGAAHKAAAEAMIDFTYRVPIAAQMANWIYYISPAEGVQEEIVNLDPEAGDNELLFPPPEVVAKQFAQPDLTPEEDEYWNGLALDLEGA
ncbi:MAG TPA: extracellular solute-binding protein [Candidatus Limnocylindrales bacterium]|nr:extracellular solute-binding protein [Candidatus Limnocylindrales bacterium]